jgi:hypothetical protein
MNGRNDLFQPNPYWLNEAMPLGHIIRVHEDGTIDEHPRTAHPGTPYAPDVTMGTRHDGQILDEHEADWTGQVRSEGWEPQTGWTGQYSYHGPVMHPSEFIGGPLADHIAETPGLWVAVEVTCDDGESAGWAILHMDDSADTDSYVVTLDSQGDLRFTDTATLRKMTLAEARETAATTSGPARITRVSDLAVMPLEAAGQDSGPDGNPSPATNYQDGPCGDYH